MWLIREALTEIEGDPPALDAVDLAAIATDLHLRAEGHDMEDIARAAACRVVPVPRLEVRAILLWDGTILVRPTRHARVYALAIAHETAHHVLRGQRHTHGDVWTLALLLAGEIAGPATRAA